MNLRFSTSGWWKKNNRRDRKEGGKELARQAQENKRQKTLQSTHVRPYN